MNKLFITLSLLNIINTFSMQTSCYNRDATKALVRLIDTSMNAERIDSQKIKSLIIEGANPNVQTFGEQWTALHLCAACNKNNEIDLVNFLLERNANPNLNTHRNHSPLQFAAENGYLDQAKALIKAGAKVNHENIIGQTALMYAQANKRPQVVKLLLECGAIIK